MKNLLYSLLLLFTLGFVSCSNDDDKGSKTEYAYTYNGDKFKVKWAGIYESVNAGYSLSISPTVPSQYLFGEDNFVNFDIPITKLGQTLDITQNNSTDPWDFYGYFNYNDEFFSITQNGNTGWVKFTKLTDATNSYHLEFDMVINGKPLKGSYKGKFTVYDNYSAVGAD